MQGLARHRVGVRRDVQHVRILRVQTGQTCVMNLPGAEVRAGESHGMVMPLLSIPASVSESIVVGVPIHLDGVDRVWMSGLVEVQVHRPGGVVRVAGVDSRQLLRRDRSIAELADQAAIGAVHRPRRE